MGRSSEPAAVAAAIQRVRQYLAEHPDDAVSTDTAAVASMEEGLRVRVVGPNGWELHTDMATAIGGQGSAPSPGWVLRAALASCDAVLIAMQCAEEGITLAHLETEVASESDDRGLLGFEGVPAGPLRLKSVIRVRAEGHTEASLRPTIERALARSPVADAIDRAVPIEVAIAG